MRSMLFSNKIVIFNFRIVKLISIVICSFILAFVYSGCLLHPETNMKSDYIQLDYGEDEIKQIYVNNEELLNKVAQRLAKSEGFRLEISKQQNTEHPAVFPYYENWQTFFSIDEWNDIKKVFELTGPREVSFSDLGSSDLKFYYYGKTNSKERITCKYVYFSHIPTKYDIENREKYYVGMRNLQKINDHWYYDFEIEKF